MFILKKLFVVWKSNSVTHPIFYLSTLLQYSSDPTEPLHWVCGAGWWTENGGQTWEPWDLRGERRWGCKARPAISALRAWWAVTPRGHAASCSRRQSSACTEHRASREDICSWLWHPWRADILPGTMGKEARPRATQEFFKPFSRTGGSFPCSVSTSVAPRWLICKKHILQVSLVHSVVSHSLQPHGLQHARLPCPSPTPGACSNSCPSSQWCHPTISSSDIPFSCLQSFPISGSFPVSQFFTSGGQSVRVSASASVLPMNIQDWFPLGLTGLTSLQSKGLSGHHSSKVSILQRSAFFIVQLSHPYMTTGKSIALTRRTFVGKVMAKNLQYETADP